MANVPGVGIQSREENFARPKMEGVSDSEKQKPSYNKQQALYIYFQYVNNRTFIPHDFDVEYYRSYANGDQSEDFYKTFLSGDTDTSNGDGIVSANLDNDLVGKERSSEGWMNLIWNIVSPLRNIMSMIEGKLIENDYDVKVHNVDLDRGSEEEDKEMAKLWNKSKFGDQEDMIKAMMGIPVIRDKDEFIPTSYRALESLKKEGFFKAPYAIQQELLLSHTEAISEWDRHNKKMHEKDLLTLGYTFARAYYDEELCKVRWRYCEPGDTIVQYSRHKEFNDSDYAGEFDYLHLSQLRQFMPIITDCETGKVGINEEDLIKISFEYSGYDSNPVWQSRNEHDKKWEYDNTKICILHTEWIDVEEEKTIEYNSKKGRLTSYPYDEEMGRRRVERKKAVLSKYKKVTEDSYIEKPDNEYISSKEKVKSVRTRMRYHCSWIVGTNYIFHYGKAPNQSRPRLNEARLAITGVKIDEKAMVKSMVPICDVFQIGWLKFLNGLSKAQSSGYAIDTSKLAMVADGNTFDPNKVVKFFREAQYLFYTSTTNGFQQGGSPVPVSKIDGTLGEELMSALTIMDSMATRLTEIVTGLSPVALGATPTSDQAVGTTERALEASTVALRPIIDSVRFLKENLAEVSTPMIGQIIRNDKNGREAYSKIIGKEGVDILNISRKDFIQYGFEMIARPTSFEKQALMQTIEKMEAARRNGIAGLTAGQGFNIYQELSNGANIKQLAYKMMEWERQDQERLDSKEQQAIKAQGDQNRATMQAAEQGKQQTIFAQMQSDAQKIKNEHDAKMIEDKAKYSHEMKLELMKINNTNKPVESGI